MRLKLQTLVVSALLSPMLCAGELAQSLIEVECPASREDAEQIETIVVGKKSGQSLADAIRLAPALSDPCASLLLSFLQHPEQMNGMLWVQHLVGPGKDLFSKASNLRKAMQLAPLVKAAWDNAQASS